MEVVLFYIAAAVAIIATTLVISRTNASHALIYLIISLLSISVIFFLLGAPFAAALEIVIYAGAIMVLFLFVVMLLNLGPAAAGQEARWLTPGTWIGPSILTFILFLVMLYVLTGTPESTAAVAVSPKEVGEKLFGPYLLAVELASILLLAALVGAYHFGRRYMRARREDAS